MDAQPMKITARVRNTPDAHDVSVATDGRERRVAIAGKSEGRGSSVNGGELLMAALATCYCNDVFREAAERGIRVTGVEVEAEAEFGAAGEAASAVRYRVRMTGPGEATDLAALGWHTDGVAEIQNTIRAGTPVVLEDVSIEETLLP